MKHINVLEDVLIVGGVSISISMIQEILGIVILVVQICLILYKGIKKIVEKVRSKKYDEISDALKETKDDLESLKDKDGK